MVITTTTTKEYEKFPLTKDINLMKKVSTVADIFQTQNSCSQIIYKRPMNRNLMIWKFQSIKVTTTLNIMCS